MKVWVRDAVTWTTDVGSTDGTFSLDLLWLARTGHSSGTGPDAAPLQFVPDVLPAAEHPVLASIEARKVDLHPDMRVPVASQEFPQQLDLLGARLLRVRMEYCLIFAPPFPTIPTDNNFEAAAQRGWYEGLIIAPFSHNASVVNDSTLGNPAFMSHAQMLDWIWWDRKYVNSQGTRTAQSGANWMLDSTLVYSDIDSRNGRRFETLGTSLYWQWRPSGPPPLPATPQQGATVNGGTASWSVLLDVPQG